MRRLKTDYLLFYTFFSFVSPCLASGDKPQESTFAQALTKLKEHNNQRAAEGKEPLQMPEPSPGDPARTGTLCGYGGASNTNSFDTATNRFKEEVKPGETVLEVGGGYGNLTLRTFHHLNGINHDEPFHELLADKDSPDLSDTKVNYFFNDFSQEQVLIAAQNLSHFMPPDKNPAEAFQGFRFVAGNILDYEPGKERFDRIDATQVLTFLKPKEFNECLGKLHSWLRPEGTLYVAIPTPYIECFKEEFRPYYIANRDKKEFAGYTEKVTDWVNDSLKKTEEGKAFLKTLDPNPALFMDKEELNTVCQKARFHVVSSGEEAVHYNSPIVNPTDEEYQNRAFAWVIAQKPAASEEETTLPLGGQ